MIDATKFARPMSPTLYPDGNKRAYRFSGESRENMAAELHKFAEGVLNGSILIQVVQTGQKACCDDFAMQALYIEFAEAVEVPRDFSAMGHERTMDLSAAK